MLSPGHYLFDITGALRHAATLSDASGEGTREVVFDLSASLSAPTLPPDLVSLFHAIGRQEITLPHVVALESQSVATVYPVELGNERLIALVVSPSDQARQTIQQATALLAMSREIHAGRTMEEIFETLARESARLLPLDRASITLFRNDTQEVEIYALQDDGSSSVKVGAIAPGEKTATAWVVQHGQPIITPDIRQESRFVVYDEWLQRGYRSTLCHPLIVDGRVIGTLNFTSCEPNAYNQDTARIVQPLAEQAAIAIHNAQLRQRLTDESRRLRRIVKVANQVKHHLSLNTGYLSISEVLRWMCEVACDMGWERALFCLRDAASASANDSFIAAFAGDFTEAQRVELDVLKSQRTKVGGFSATPGGNMGILYTSARSSSLRLRACSSVNMSMFQCVSLAVSLTFWPFLPMASDN